MAKKSLKLFFDLDGTLLDIEPRHYSVYSEVVKELGGQPLERSRYWDLKRSKTNWTKLLNLSGLAPVVEKKFLDRFIKKIEDQANLRNDMLFPGTIETLGKLQSTGCKCYLVSLRRQPRRLREQIRNLGLSNHFTSILVGHSESNGYDIKIRLIKSVLQGDNGIIIGDSEADILAGQELAITTIAMTSGIRDEKFLSKLAPDYLSSDIRQIPDIIKNL